MQPGDHLVSLRLGYTHHGLYLGDGRVIHYSGFSDGWTSGAIEIVSLSDFEGGSKTYVKSHLVPHTLANKV
jgi:cell wall-associated NlpC family hydrolase